MNKNPLVIKKKNAMGFPRRGFVGSLALTAAVLVTTGAVSTQAATDLRMPNVVVVFVDHLGWKDLGCYGSKFYETPNIDRLAGQGALFSRAYSSSNVCSPTRVSLMTGKYPQRVGFTTYLNPGRSSGANSADTHPDHEISGTNYHDGSLPHPSGDDRLQAVTRTDPGQALACGAKAATATRHSAIKIRTKSLISFCRATV
jgi:hypothetical protein